MKKSLFILKVIIIVTTCSAQDTLVKKTGEVIHAKILEINPSDIKYLLFDYQDGPTFIESNSDIRTIRYKNGALQTFPESIVSPVNNSFETTLQIRSLSSEEMRLQGTEDAQRFYKGKNSGAGGTTAACIFLGPIYGLISAVACASKPPKDINLNYKDAELMRNPEYSQAYRKQAHKIKKNKVWSNYSIGLVVELSILYTIFSIYN